MKSLFQAGFVLFLSLGLLGSAKALTPGEAIWQDGVAYRIEGKQMQEAGDLRRASAAYRKAIAVYPVYAEAYNDLGVVLESMGDLAGAEESYLAALKLKPELVSAHSNLALFYEERGKIKEASEHWAARVRVGAPNDPWVMKARQKLLQYNLPVPESAEATVTKRADKARQAIQAEQARREAKRWSEAIRREEAVKKVEEERETPQAHSEKKVAVKKTKVVTPQALQAYPKKRLR